jgi:nucleoside recognition membrane protein YjiH
MKKTFIALVASIMGVFLFFTPISVQAAPSANPCNRATGIFSALPTWYEYLKLDANCSVTDFQVPGDIWKVAIACIEILLRVAGLIAFGVVVYMGFKFVLSRGNPSEAAKARQGIIDAAIGIAISSLATVIISFIARELIK